MTDTNSTDSSTPIVASKVPSQDKATSTRDLLVILNVSNKLTCNSDSKSEEGITTATSPENISPQATNDPIPDSIPEKEVLMEEQKSLINCVDEYLQDTVGSYETFKRGRWQCTDYVDSQELDNTNDLHKFDRKDSSHLEAANVNTNLASASHELSTLSVTESSSSNDSECILTPAVEKFLCQAKSRKLQESLYDDKNVPINNHHSSDSKTQIDQSIRDDYLPVTRSQSMFKQSLLLYSTKFPQMETTTIDASLFNSKLEQAIDLARNDILKTMTSELNALKKRRAELSAKLSQLEQVNKILRCKSRVDVLQYFAVHHTEGGSH